MAKLVAVLGLAIGRVNLVDQLLADGRLVRLMDQSLRLEFGPYLVHHDGNPSRAVTRIEQLHR